MNEECVERLYYASRHIPSSLYPVEYEFRRVFWFSVRIRNRCPTEKWRTVGRVWANGRIGGTRMSSRHRKSRLRLALSRGVVGGDVKCTERALQMSRTAASLSRRVARPRSARNRLSRVWARSSWIGFHTLSNIPTIHTAISQRSHSSWAYSDI